MTSCQARLIVIAILATAFSAPISAQQETVAELQARAEQGDAEACVELGRRYLEGRGVSQDEVAAMRWFELAANQGHADGQVNLGFVYATGLGVPQDLVAAAGWYELAANQGHAFGQVNLGFMCFHGQGVPQDDVAAARWFELAANQGEAAAQSILGFMYFHGQGVPQDDVAAARWSELAANQGHPEAQVNLGAMYVTGQGVPQDNVTAYMWFYLSASRARGNFLDLAVERRDLLEAELTPNQLAEAHRLAREWEARDVIPSGKTPTPDYAPEAFDALRPPESRGGTGTAFIVHPDGLLLTAHHVIEHATSIAVSCDGQPAVPAVVTANSPTIDLALLEAAGDLGTESFLRLSLARVPSLGDRVFTIGFPTPSLLGPDPKYTNGTVSALSGPGGDASFLQISAPVQPGNSGGPLVNEETGDVIGVIVSTADDATFLEATDSIPQNVNWAIKSVFASVLFTPPSANVTSSGSDDIITRVVEATCFVQVTGSEQ